MIEHVQARLEQLKAEFHAGEEQLGELMRREAELRETLLRISGAVQVLQEVLESATSSSAASATSASLGVQASSSAEGGHAVPAPVNGSSTPSGTVLTVP